MKADIVPHTVIDSKILLIRGRKVMLDKDLCQPTKSLLINWHSLRKIEKHDNKIKAIFRAIRQLMSLPPETKKRKIGFGREGE